MELTAAIKAIDAVDATLPIILHTDSTYVQKGITEWI
jgi:ribonuclease HI